MKTDISLSGKSLYEFGSFRLDSSVPLLLRSGEVVPLAPKTLDVLVMLVEKRGALLSKDQLMSAVWPDTFVEESNLAHHISLLRKTLGNVDNGQPYIETIPKRGYRFIGSVRQTSAEAQLLSDDIQPATVPQALTAPTSFKPSRWLTMGVLLTAIGLLIGIAVAWRFLRSAAEPSSADLVLNRLTSDSGLTTDPVLFSPGKLLAFASDRSGEGNLDIWVQRLGSATPIRLTKDPADERWPTISPDGTSIAFRTERNGGGIEIVPIFGGEPRLIARGGERPRFSSDGKWIAYWLGGVKTNPAQRVDQEVFIVPSAGGVPKRIQPEFLTARYPVWSPDGKHLMFTGWRDGNGPAEENFDWWVTPVDGGPAVKTGVAAALRRAGLAAYPIPGDWAGNRVVFSAQLGDSTSLWQVEISPRTWQISGAPRRLTTTTSLDGEPSIAADGRLVYASLAENIDIWSLPLDANRGKTTGELQPLTRNAASDTSPSVSLDGEKMVFVSERTGNNDVWLKDLVNGEEISLTMTASEQRVGARISRDGSNVAYSTGGATYVVPIGTAGRATVATKVCEACGGLSDLTPDGKGLLLSTLHPHGSGLIWLDLVSGQRQEIISHPRYFLNQPSFSPDGRWIVINAAMEPGRGNNTYVVPFRRAAAIPQQEWIAAIEGSGTVARWSPNNSRLYFFSTRDGWSCIYTQALDPATKRPVGAPRAVYHLHNSRYTLPQYPAFAFSIARDKAVFSMRELTGNIWMASPKTQP